MVGAFSPKTLDEALEIRAVQSVIPFAGGTDLMVRSSSLSRIGRGFDDPILFLGGVEGLGQIIFEEGVLTVGAGATWASLIENNGVPEVLKVAARGTASPAIRNMGTLGGNICNASPAADAIPPLVALGASVVLQNLARSRRLPVETFVQGPGQTALADDELLVAIEIPADTWSVTYYRKVGTRKANSLSKVSIAGLARVEERQIKEVRVALGAVAPTVVRSQKAEEILVDRRTQEIPSVLPAIIEEYSPLITPIDDQRSSAAYRHRVSIRLIEDFVMSLPRRG